MGERMNCDEAIKSIKERLSNQLFSIGLKDWCDKCVDDYYDVMALEAFVVTAKKEHELFQKKEKLLDLYQAIFGKSKPEYYEVSTQDLWSQIKKLEREFNE